jgi:hypothetical protein
VRFALLALALACGRGGSPEHAAEGRQAQVRFRPVEQGDDAHQRLLSTIPKAGLDRGLTAAARDLLAQARDRASWVDTASSRAALTRAGYPGQVRWLRALNGGAWPEELVEAAISGAGDEAVDVAIAHRRWSDGSTLWLLGFAPRRAELDPMPRDLAVDSALPVQVFTPGREELRLFVASPNGPVEELSLTSGVARWVDRFHTPGEYRLEVVGEHKGVGRVLLLFSVLVEQPPPAQTPLPLPPSRPGNPVEAEAWLHGAVNALRAEHGLRPLTRFPLYEPLAREHSALMAAEDAVLHRIPGRTEGVAARATKLAHPPALHRENVAAALTAAEALALVADSPGHLQNLLCEPCSQLSVGVALEPVLHRTPRLFVTLEVLETPRGLPQRLPESVLGAPP